MIRTFVGNKHWVLSTTRTPINHHLYWSVNVSSDLQLPSIFGYFVGNAIGWIRLHYVHANQRIRLSYNGKQAISCPSTTPAGETFPLQRVCWARGPVLAVWDLRPYCLHLIGLFAQAECWPDLGFFGLLLGDQPPATCSVTRLSSPKTIKFPFHKRV